MVISPELLFISCNIECCTDEKKAIAGLYKMRKLIAEPATQPGFTDNFTCEDYKWKS